MPSVAQAPSSPPGSPVQRISGHRYLACLCSRRPFCGRPGTLGLGVCWLSGLGSFRAAPAPGVAPSVRPCCSGACPRAHCGASRDLLTAFRTGRRLRGSRGFPKLPTFLPSTVVRTWFFCPVWGYCGSPQGPCPERLLTAGWPWSFPFLKCSLLSVFRWGYRVIFLWIWKNSSHPRQRPFITFMNCEWPLSIYGLVCWFAFAS